MEDEESTPFTSEEDLRKEIILLLTGASDMFAMPAPEWEERAQRVLDELGPVWSPNADQDAKCGREGCAHPYHRHFDSYEDMAPVGCKYCSCHRFVPAA